ncbi:MAG: hypothetical protein ACRDSR_27270, partial [Pseudonocardiaceae bacterium]
LVGDAELDEGSNHEAIAYAGATRLDGLTAIVVDNQSATHGWPDGLATRFGVNGHAAHPEQSRSFGTGIPAAYGTSVPGWSDCFRPVASICHVRKPPIQRGATMPRKCDG